LFNAQVINKCLTDINESNLEIRVKGAQKGNVEIRVKDAPNSFESFIEQVLGIRVRVRV
jgi:hypothetical protein